MYELYFVKFEIENKAFLKYINYNLEPSSLAISYNSIATNLKCASNPCMYVGFNFHKSKIDAFGKKIEFDFIKWKIGLIRYHKY